ncbi:MAG: hypothetical protein KGJ23_06035 [Euryarchaeota archaeon]|nr:hypothetical protein [Euryarchaeota archaeon]
MIPWFGAIKLWLSGNGSDVPPETGEYLGLTTLAILVLPTDVPKLIQRWKERASPRKKGGSGDEEESDDLPEQLDSESSPHRED